MTFLPSSGCSLKLVIVPQEIPLARRFLNNIFQHICKLQACCTKFRGDDERSLCANDSFVCQACALHALRSHILWSAHHTAQHQPSRLQTFRDHPNITRDHPTDPKPPHATPQPSRSNLKPPQEQKDIVSGACWGLQLITDRERSDIIFCTIRLLLYSYCFIVL